MNNQTFIKFIFLLLIGLIISANSIAQINFQKTYGGIRDDYGYSVQQCVDGGYIIAGKTNSIDINNTYSDCYLIKTDENGSTVWTKTFGGLINDVGNSALQTNDGGFILAGIYYNSVGSNINDIYLVKTDSAGDTLWTKTIGDNSDQRGLSIQETNDGGYIITGLSCCVAGSSGVYLARTNNNGNVLWTKTFGGASNGSTTGNAVQNTNDGGFIICGYTNSFGAGGSDVYLIKTDSMGTVLWSKTYGGSGNDEGYSVQQTIDGGYIIGGNTSFGIHPSDAYLIKTDSIGNLKWSKTFGSTGNELISSVKQTNDGNYLMTGNSTSSSFGSFDVILIKTDSSGNLLWTKDFGGTAQDRANSVQQTNDGGFIIAGYTESFGAGGYDIYLIKTDSAGESICNQDTITLITTTPPTQVGFPATIVGSVGISTAPPTIVGNGGITTSLCSTVDILVATSKNDGINIFPNPATNHIIIELPSPNKKVEVTISDIAGKIIFRASAIETKRMDVNTNDFAEGIYLVKIQAAVYSEIKKLIVTK